MATIKPECRFCGTRVKHFGELCEGCEPHHTEETLEFDRLCRMDAAALRP